MWTAKIATLKCTWVLLGCHGTLSTSEKPFEVHFKCSWNHTWARTSTALNQSDNNQFNRVCFTKIEGHDFIFFLSFQWLMLPFSQQLRLSQFSRWFRRSHFDVSICKTDRKDLEISHPLCKASLVFLTHNIYFFKIIYHWIGEQTAWPVPGDLSVIAINCSSERHFSYIPGSLTNCRNWAQLVNLPSSLYSSAFVAARGRHIQSRTNM